MCKCSICNSNDYIKLNIKTEEIDISWDGKVHFPKRIIIYFCLNCKNIYGDILN